MIDPAELPEFGHAPSHDATAILLIFVALIGTTIVAGGIAGFMDGKETGLKAGKFVLVLGSFFAISQVLSGTALYVAAAVLASFWGALYFVLRRRAGRS